MPGARLQAEGGGRFRLEGRLDFDSVPQLLAISETLFSGEPEIHVDLSGVDHSNSAALGLLLEWIDRARAAGQKIHFHHLPSTLADIARVSNVEPLLQEALA